MSVAKPQRKDFEQLPQAEQIRYAIAVRNMQVDIKSTSNNKGALNDWWNICAIHGGGFYDIPQIKSSMKPFFDRYVQEYSDITGNWQTSGFCAHGIPTFMVWHRVYMQCYEVLLQQYDPNKADVAAGRMAPLMAHYWKWDNGTTKIPDFINRQTLPDGSPNPLYHAKIGTVTQDYNHSEWTVRGDDSRIHDPFHGVDQEYPGAISDLVEAMSNPNYTRASQQVERPHGMLHLTVGGEVRTPPNPAIHNQYGAINVYIDDETYFGHMYDPPCASFDPIFWLHHSNVERHHTMWLARHPAPTKMMGFSKNDRNVDYYKKELFPFPPGAITYGKLPWRLGTNSGLATKPKEWLKNDTLSYTYDDLVHIGSVTLLLPLRVTSPALPAVSAGGRGGRGGRAPASISVATPAVSVPPPAAMVSAAHIAPRQPTEKRFVELADLPIHGPGKLTATISLGGKEIVLPQRGIFLSSRDFQCANCVGRGAISIDWSIDVPVNFTGEPVLVSCTFQGHEITPIVRWFKEPDASDQASDEEDEEEEEEPKPSKGKGKGKGGKTAKTKTVVKASYTSMKPSTRSSTRRKSSR